MIIWEAGVPLCDEKLGLIGLVAHRTSSFNINEPPDATNESAIRSSLRVIKKKSMGGSLHPPVASTKSPGGRNTHIGRRNIRPANLMTDI